MNYSGFKSYLARFLWRNGDTVFEADLDNMIDMAHARLNRDLRIQRMVVTAQASLTADTLVLPADYNEMRTITSDSPPAPMQYVSPYERERIKLANASSFQPIYTIAGNAIFFVGPMAPTDNPPRSVTMTYFAKVPDFAVTNSSWLADEYLDLYTYAVLRHTPAYLKDDERVVLWKNEYDETLASVVNAEAGRRNLEEIKEDLIFYKSNRSERWWMEVPYPSKQGVKYERHHLVPCDKEDYELAMKSEIPNLWWKTYQKLG